MSGYQVIEVGIGLAFVYLLLALICSAVNEAIAGLFNLRARTLEKAIRQLLNPSRKGAQKSAAPDVYGHPLVRALHQRGVFGGWRKPSYIPAQTFALALLDTVAPEEKDDTAPARLGSLRKAVAEQWPEALKRQVLPLMDETAKTVADARLRVERWFNDAMERASGVYKRQVQWILLVLALLVAGGLNVNTFEITRTLWMNREVRQAVVDAAGKAAPPAEAAGPVASLQAVANGVSQVQQLGLPMGWTPERWKTRNWQAIPGWLFTAVAVSFGAPFWFDTLNALLKMNVRAAGAKPKEESAQAAG